MTEQPDQPDIPADVQTKQLDDIVRWSNRLLASVALAVSSALVILVLVASFFGYHFYNQIKTTQDQINNAKKSTCDFYLVIGTLPVVPSGPERSSKTLVRIIVDARVTYIKRACGNAPNVSAALAHLSQLYGIPIR